VQHAVYVEISGFWQAQEVWGSDIYDQSLIYLGYRKPDVPTEICKKARSELVIISCE
jgi:hypothetical protein